MRVACARIYLDPSYRNSRNCDLQGYLTKIQRLAGKIPASGNAGIWQITARMAPHRTRDHLRPRQSPWTRRPRAEKLYMACDNFHSLALAAVVLGLILAYPQPPLDLDLAAPLQVFVSALGSLAENRDVDAVQLSEAHAIRLKSQAQAIRESAASHVSEVPILFRVGDPSRSRGSPLLSSFAYE
jgi:hypothetical protein